MRSAASSLPQREQPMDHAPTRGGSGAPGPLAGATGCAPGDEAVAGPRVRAALLSLTQLLGGNLLLGLAGLASLPVLARNLGAAHYGAFSLFVALLGVVSNLDPARPLLVRELSAGAAPGARARLERLATTSALLLAPLGFALGTLLGGAASGVALGLGAALHALASAPYARLAAEGRVGLAGALRNVLWTAALAATVALSFHPAGPRAAVWPFVAANALLLALLRGLCGARAEALPAPGLAVVREHASAARDVVGFSAASAVVVAADRAILARVAPAELGRYGAQYDLATKLNVLSTALGSVLFPLLSRLHREQGHLAAARTFVRVASWIALGYFLVLAALIAGREEVVRLVLGADFHANAATYGAMLVGVFLHLFGFLVAPWQRACGDFATHRRAYALAAGLMVLVGLVAIPLWGAPGAAATYLVARSAEVVLVASVVRTLPREVLPRWRVATLAAMALGLAALAAAGGDA